MARRFFQIDVRHEPPTPRRDGAGEPREKEMRKIGKESREKEKEREGKQGKKEGNKKKK